MEYGTGGQKPCTTRLRRRLPAIIDASPIAAAMKTTPMATVDAERPSCTVKGLPARDGEAIVMVTPPGAKSNAFRPGTGTGGSGTRAAPCPCGGLPGHPAGLCARDGSIRPRISGLSSSPGATIQVNPSVCIAVPVKILAIEGEHATVDYGGLKRAVSISLVKNQVVVGDFVIIHAGAAIQRIDPEEAKETIALMQEMLGE